MFVRLPVATLHRRRNAFLPGVPGARRAAAADIARALRSELAGSPVIAAGLDALLRDAAARLMPIARGIGGEVQVLSSRQAGTAARRLSVSAGAYRHDNVTPGWDSPRPGDSDFLWGERARAVAGSLHAADWTDGLAGDPAQVALVARPAGVFLFLADGSGAAVVHAVDPAGGLRLCGMQPLGERRSLVSLFERYAPLDFVSVDHFAAQMVADIGRYLEPFDAMSDAERSDPQFHGYLRDAEACAAAGQCDDAVLLLTEGAGLFADEAISYLESRGYDADHLIGATPSGVRASRPGFSWIPKMKQALGAARRKRALLPGGA